MNTYLLTFNQKPCNKVIHAWHDAENAGVPVNMLEELGVDIIRTVKLRCAENIRSCKATLPDLVFWIRIMKETLEYKDL